MKTKIFRVLLIFTAVLVIAGCNKALQMNEEDGSEPKVVEENDDCVVNEDGEISLKGTKWKLAGLVMDSGEIIEPTPTECEECYTLWFDTDYTATVISIARRLKLDLSISNDFEIGRLIIEKYDEIEYDFSGLFTVEITRFQSYSATCDELKFYSGGRCLLFKPYEGDIQLETMYRGTRWKLSGIVDEKTGDLKELEPVDCSECYTLLFAGEHYVSIRSINASHHYSLINFSVFNPLLPSFFDRSQDKAEEWTKHSWGGGDGNFYEDSIIFRWGIIYAESYELSSDELKIFFTYLGNNYYLTFKCIYR